LPIVSVAYADCRLPELVCSGRVFAIVSLLGALPGSACLIDGTIGRAETGGMSDASGGETGSSVETTSGWTDGATSMDVSAGTGTDGLGSGDSASAHHADEVSATVGHPNACEITAEDTECAACRRNHCCAALLACHDVPECWCEWGCRSQPGHDIAMCQRICGSDGALLGELIACTQSACAEACTDPLMDGPDP
jgi:hypothetical protein